MELKRSATIKTGVMYIHVTGSPKFMRRTWSTFYLNFIQRIPLSLKLKQELLPKD